MSILDTFYILFDSDASKLDKGLKASEDKADSLIDKLKSVDLQGAKAGSSLYDLIGKTAGVLGVGLSIGALIAGVQDSVAAYTALEKLADEFRSTASAMDEFQSVAKLLGISEEDATKGLKGLEGTMQKAIKGSADAKKSFQELGISITDAKGKVKPTTEVMGELADKLRDMDEAKRLDITEKLGLDSSMLKMFNSDAGDLQRRIAEVGRVSGLNLEMAVKRAAEFTKASKGLTSEFGLLKLYLEKLTEKFKISTMPFFTDALTTATKYVRMFVEYLMKHSKFVEGFVIAIGGAILYFLVPAAIQGAMAVWAMIAPFALVGAAAIALGVAFALAYDDIMNFMEGGDSLIGDMLNKWPVLGEIAKTIGEAFKSLWSLAIQVMEFMAKMWNNPAAAFNAFLSMVMNGIKSLLNAIPGLSSVMKAIGIGGATGEALNAGKQAISAASATPLASSSSTSISNSKSSKSSSVSIGKVEVKTQATDAAGISKAIGGSMETQMRQAVNNFDDGVLA